MKCASAFLLSGFLAVAGIASGVGPPPRAATAARAAPEPGLTDRTPASASIDHRLPAERGPIGGEAPITPLSNALGVAQVAEPPTLSLTVPPDTCAYAPFSVTWQASDPSSVVRIEGVDLALPAAGSRVISLPEGATDVRASVTGSDGASRSVGSSLTVRNLPRVTFFTVTPSQAPPNTPVTLGWDTTDAASIEISGLGAVGPRGTLSVVPRASTAYVLTAANSCGSMTGTAIAEASPVGPYNRTRNLTLDVVFLDVESCYVGEICGPGDACDSMRDYRSPHDPLMTVKAGTMRSLDPDRARQYGYGTDHGVRRCVSTSFSAFARAQLEAYVREYSRLIFLWTRHGLQITPRFWSVKAEMGSGLLPREPTATGFATGMNPPREQFTHYARETGLDPTQTDLFVAFTNSYPSYGSANDGLLVQAYIGETSGYFNGVPMVKFGPMASPAKPAGRDFLVPALVHELIHTMNVGQYLVSRLEDVYGTQNREQGPGYDPVTNPRPHCYAQAHVVNGTAVPSKYFPDSYNWLDPMWNATPFVPYARGSAVPSYCLGDPGTGQYPSANPLDANDHYEDIVGLADTAKYYKFVYQLHYLDSYYDTFETSFCRNGWLDTGPTDPIWSLGEHFEFSADGGGRCSSGPRPACLETGLCFDLRFQPQGPVDVVNSTPILNRGVTSETTQDRGVVGRFGDGRALLIGAQEFFGNTSEFEIEIVLKPASLRAASLFTNIDRVSLRLDGDLLTVQLRDFGVRDLPQYNEKVFQTHTGLTVGRWQTLKVSVANSAVVVTVDGREVGRSVSDFFAGKLLPQDTNDSRAVVSLGWPGLEWSSLDGQIQAIRFFNGAHGVGAPTVGSLAPPSGPTTGGTSVTVTGSGFASGATVTFGGALATDVVLNGPTSISCRTPAGSAGPVTVSVTTSSGTGSLPSAFTYTALPQAPTVTSVSPGSGPTAGGTSVMITGTGFTSGASVTFGGAPATSIVVSGSTAISCTTPAGSSGSVTVSVTTSSGTGSLPNGFTYTDDPGSGPAASCDPADSWWGSGEWTVVQTDPALLPAWRTSAAGIADVPSPGPDGGFLRLHPLSSTDPAIIRWTGRLSPAWGTLALNLGNSYGDFLLRCRINGTEIFARVIRGFIWQRVDIDIGPWRDSNVTIDLEAAAGGVQSWSFETCYVDSICFQGQIQLPGASLCVDDSNGDCRFKVEVDWHTVQGGNDGQPHRASCMTASGIGAARGGLFWFFNQDNPELLVKVLNGCSVNNKFWFFASAGTNVGLDVRVTDTRKGITRTYVNPDITPAPPIQDITAFSCN